MQDRLKVYEQAVARAREYPDQASMFVSFAIAKDMIQKEDDFTMVLAPFMHGDRCSPRPTVTYALHARAVAAAVYSS